MTLEEAFIKGAEETFARHKMANVGLFLRRLMPALAKGGDGFFKTIGGTYGTLNRVGRRKMWGQLAGGTLGGLAAYNATDDDAGFGQHLLNTVAGAGLGGLGGGVAAKYAPKLFK